MSTLCEIHGINGDVWSLEQDGDDQYLMHTMDPKSSGPLHTIPIDEHVLAALLRASRAAPVRVDIPAPAENVVSFRKIVPGAARSVRIEGVVS